MAAKKKDEAEPKDEGNPLTAREMMIAALEVPKLRGIPTLLGPSGGGKTWLVQEVHASRHPGGVLVTVVPATESGDELAGIPLRPERAMQTVQWSLPLCIPDTLLKKGGTIFVDELDKAAPDVWPVLLRLFAERKLRDVVLPDNVDILCAANSPQMPLPDPLVGRLFWIRYPEPVDAPMDDTDLMMLPKQLLARLEEQQGKAVSETRYPDIPPSRRAAHRLASWLRWPAFWGANKSGKQRVLAGVLPAKDVPEALETLSRTGAMGSAEAAVVFVRSASPSSLLAAWPDIHWNLPTEAQKDILLALNERVSADGTSEWGKVWDLAVDRCILSGRGATPERQKVLLAEWRKKIKS